MLTRTGVSMRSLGAPDLFDAAYASMTQMALLNEEERKAIDALDNRISDASFEAATGMPAVTQWMPPANADALPPHVMLPDRGDTS